jgi:hypothetical protein
MRRSAVRKWSRTEPADPFLSFKRGTIGIAVRAYLNRFREHRTRYTSMRKNWSAFSSGRSWSGASP